MRIRYATPADFDGIKALARKHEAELGWLRDVTIRQFTEQREIFVAASEDGIQGFVRWHARRDVWNTLHEICVEPCYRKYGIGRLLLYAVPCPVRLKCPVDLPSNDFYRKSGMTLAGTEPGKQRALNIWERRVLAVIVRGGNRDVPAICRESGQAYGVQKETAYSWPFMLDIEWEDYDWDEYLERVKYLRPIMAMAADYMEPGQKELLLSQIADLKASGVLRVLVCPKFHGAVKDIPEDCVVAVSLRTQGKLAKGKRNKFAGFMPDWNELRGRKVHLLGGSPQLQKKTMAELQGVGAVVISVDGNAHLGAAANGSLYEDGRWRRKNGEAVTLRATQVKSSQNIVRELEAAGEYSQLGLFGEGH